MSVPVGGSDGWATGYTAHLVSLLRGYVGGLEVVRSPAVAEHGEEDDTPIPSGLQVRSAGHMG
jgi:hypothetical protein